MKEAFFIIFILLECVAIGYLFTRLKPIPKKKGKKYDEALRYDVKIFITIIVCFIAIIITGNLLAGCFDKAIPVRELKEYEKVEKYSYEDGNVVREFTGDNLYVKSGKLYEVTKERKSEEIIFTEITLPEDKNPRIYVAMSESDTDTKK